MPRRPSRGVGVVLFAIALTWASGSRARRDDGPAMEAFRRQARQQERGRQDLFDRLGKPPGPAQAAAPFPADDADEDEAAPRPVGALAPENFDLWVFRDGGGVGEANRRERMESLLTIKAEETARVHRLAPADAVKLRLAGRGDVKHYFDRLAGLRRDFDLVRKDRDAGLEFLRSLQDERMTYQDGPFGAGSLFEKTLARLLADRRLAAPRPS